MRVERHQWIGLRIICRTTTIGKRVTDRSKITHPSLDAIGRFGNEIDAISVLQTSLLQFRFVEKDDIPLTIDTSISVRHRINRRIVLIVASNRTQPKRFQIVFEAVLSESVIDEETRLSRRGRPNSFASI